MSDEPACEINVDDNKPGHIEIVVNEYKVPVPPICKQWHKVKHRRSDADNQRFLELHPECDLQKTT